MITFFARLRRVASQALCLPLLILRGIVLALGALVIIMAGVLVQIGLSWIFR